MAIASNLGFPRIGSQRELKKYLEDYWNGIIGEEEFQRSANALKRKHWKLQQAAGIQHIPSHDAAYYDHVLDHITLFSLLPSRFQKLQKGSLSQYFAMARGSATPAQQIPAMEMTKWFDTNYHYIAPEFETGMQPSLGQNSLLDEYKTALGSGLVTRPVLLGPMSFLALGKFQQPTERSTMLSALLEVYAELFSQLKKAGVDWLQIDEPVFSLTHDDAFYREAVQSYQKIQADRPRIVLTTYFTTVALDKIAAIPCEAVHLDCVRGRYSAHDIVALGREKEYISLGMINGRNIWRSALRPALHFLTEISESLDSSRIMIAPSCSLLHVPVDASMEDNLDPAIQPWLAYAVEKLGEIRVLTQALNEGEASVETELAKNDQIILSRHQHPGMRNATLRKRMAEIDEKDLHRQQPFEKRMALQQSALKLPLFPTTTIGSFPQTKEIRKARAEFRKRRLSPRTYETFMQKEIAKVISFQEDTGLDVLVHGEAERNDMVEYFGEQLDGFFSTKHGWVQSYGSRCVKPPVIFADVLRPQEMTVKWTSFAQSLTESPIKGMLTGPTTMLQWSFVRDDLPHSEVAMQIALAIRDEVQDLEEAGISIIQVDEPAFREGLPLQEAAWPEYIEWSTKCFRLATSGVSDSTQIHTHMCYSEFNDFIEAIAALDADVISIESSRSDMELLRAFTQVQYPNAIGPGVYDIHSPNVPDSKDMYQLLKEALKVIKASQLWVNPDCGLKTRKWKEVGPALKNMVQAARQLRTELS